MNILENSDFRRSVSNTFSAFAEKFLDIKNVSNQQVNYC